jgi:two-component system CheB/CheR fusion protein
VAVTGYGHEEARVRSEKAGFDRHLVKPVDPQTLCELLAEIGTTQEVRVPSGEATSGNPPS